MLRDKRFRLLMDLLIAVFSTCCWSISGVLTYVSAAEQMTVTDLAGREVKLTVPVERVVIQGSGSGGPFFTLFALLGAEAPEKIVGMDPGLKRNRQWLWKKYTETFPQLEQIPEVGNAKDLNVEGVIALQPDVVIVSNQSYQSTKDIYSTLERAGIPVLTIDYHVETLETHTQSMALLGKILGKEERAHELITFYTEQCDRVASRLQDSELSRPSVYIEVGHKGPAEYSNSYGKYMWGELVEQSGGANIAQQIIENYGPINPEFLLQANPEIIVLTGSYWPANPTSMKLGYYADQEESRELLQAFLTRQGWDALQAVKNARVYAIHHVLAREIWDFFAIQSLAKWFHPDIFSDLDPEANFHEFHARFLQVEYSGVWKMELQP